MAVFISYHNSRSETVEHVARYLQRHGIEAWYAPRNIPPGAAWDEAIVSAIRASEALVLLFDSSADASRHIKREIHTADEYGIPIRWLRLEQIQPSGLEYYLGLTQWIDWLDARDEALEQLVNSLPGHSPDNEGRSGNSIAPPVDDVAPSPRPMDSVVAPYTEWTPRPLPPMNEATWDDVVDGLVEIVRAEGPMLVHRAFQLYVKGMGGHRMGTAITEDLQHALERGLRQGRVARLKDYVRGTLNRTLYIPGTPPAVPRELGPRHLTEVPKSEIQELVRRLGLPLDSEDVPRAVQQQLGVKRLTEQALAYIDECREYHYHL